MKASLITILAVLSLSPVSLLLAYIAWLFADSLPLGK